MNDGQTKSRSPWIMSRGLDLLLIVLAPLLIIPSLALANAQWSTEGVCLFVLSFGSLGHHLPGMIRAYGDRELFARFKRRFIFGPIFLVVVSVLSVTYGLKGLILVSVMWGVWHALMQTYGFGRIYDAKQGVKSSTWSWLDFALCLTWFVAAVVLSEERSAMLLQLYYESSGWPISAATVVLVRRTWWLLTVLVSGLYILCCVRDYYRGTPPSPVKTCLLFGSIAFYWFANIMLDNLLLGLAMFELFHDVQYLAIVWLYNCNQNQKGVKAGPILSFVFRRSWTLVGLYVGLVSAYGSLRLIEQGVLHPGRVRDVLTALLAASGLLHYYYDGFIWKVRDASTKSGLGISEANTTKPRVASPSMTHLAKWIGFVVPLAVLSAMQWCQPISEADQLGRIARSLPGHAQSRANYGFALHDTAQVREAEREYRSALLLNPDLVDANLNLASLYRQRNRNTDAVARYRRVLQLEPDNQLARIGLGRTLCKLGQLQAAEDELRAVVQQNPDAWDAQHALALVMARAGDAVEAEAMLQRIVEETPNDARAWYNLGGVLRNQHRWNAAVAAYRRSLQVEPNNVSVMNNMGTTLVQLGKTREAIECFQRVLELAPHHRGAQQNLARARALDSGT